MIEMKVITKTKIEGDLIFDGEIIFENEIEITGKLKALKISFKRYAYIHKSIEAGEWIEAGESIKAGGWIEAVGWIDAVGWIKAGESIKAGGWIEAGESIKAGGSIKVGGWIEAGESIKAGERIKAGEWIEAGGWIEAGEYLNLSFEILDLSKIKTTVMRFTTSYYHERKFWINQLSEIEDVGELVEFIRDDRNCFNKVIEKAKEFKKQILSYQHFMPAIRQAIELMLGEENERKDEIESPETQ